MADEFDPLKQQDNKPTEELYATIQKDTINNNTNQDDLLRFPFENILKLSNNQTNKPPEQQQQQTKEETYQNLNYTNNAYKAPIRSTNPFHEDVQKPSPPPTSTNVTQQLPQEKPKVSEQQKERYWDNTEDHQGPNYETEPPNYYSEEYYEEPAAHKRRGFAGALDRLVQRFPVLAIFHKPPPPESYENYETEQGHEYVEEESVEAPQLVDANSSERELTANELALNERYSNKSRTQIISLQKKDQTQPVDVCIHHDSYTLYSCDVGRSVVEIFDMYGKLQHVIDDQTTIKLQPTSIAVANDGTIIVASHFNHRLHMYSPDDNENAYDGYHFKQYKLGSPGHDIHQFHHPAGIAIDFSDGYLYVCDRGNFRIQVMRPEGVCERVIDLVSLDEQQSPINPVQIAHQQNGDKIVCIIGKGDAICFTSKYADGPTYVEPLYILDNDGLGLQGASGLAIDSNDRIFISDTGHHRIIICAPDGSYITHIGVEGDGPGQLKRPCGLDITNDGTIVVADSGNKRLQLFGSIREQTIEDKKSTSEKSDVKNILLMDPENPVK